ncbi:MAG: hypothetical protein R3E02_13590 [Blastomonas sp.]
MNTTSNSARRPTPRWRIITGVILLILIGVTLYMLPTLRAYSQTGASYAARVACSCRYLGGRDLSDCKKDLEPGMEVVWLSEDEGKQRVNASVPLLADESAEFRPGYGCVLMTEKDREAD